MSTYALAKAMGQAIDSQFIRSDPPTKKRPSEDPRINLEQIIRSFASMYKLTIAPTSKYPEYFSFSTGSKANWLVIQGDPRTIRHKGFGDLPWHVAFGKKIIRSNSGCHTWTIQTNESPNNIKVGVYFGTNINNIKADFGHGRMPGGSETYFTSKGAHMAGIHYGDGSIFGGEAHKLKKIAKGNLIMKLNTKAPSLSFFKKNKSCTFIIRELVDLTKKNRPWECIMFVAIGSGGLYMRHEAKIANYSHQADSKL